MDDAELFAVTGEVSVRVTSADLASTLAVEEQDRFPPLLATARMIELMEIAAARVMWPRLKPGDVSVGVSLNVSHSAPTAVNATVTASARFLRSEGPIWVFEVFARDAGGEIGKGEHRRAIVSEERLVSKAKHRLAQA